jgi:hypothetical protein
MSDDKVMQMLNYIKNLNRQLDSSIAVKEREIANGNPELLNSLRLSKEAGMSGSGLQDVGSKASQFLGRAINPQTLDNVQIKPEQGKKIAEAFENMKHDPNNPDVKAAYEALIKETSKQYDEMLKQGFKVSKIKPGQENPYKSSKDLHKDISENKHLSYFPTEQGFGSQGKDFSDHPLMTKTPYTDPDGGEMLANDLFRIVHDYRGHNLGQKSGFGPKGEQMAYLQHKKDFSPLANKALFTETAGQNNTVNWGKFGEQNRMSPVNTVYADQKAGLLHDDVINEKWHSPTMFENLKTLFKGKK